jgi:FixJ family two-component response regulator
MSADPTVFLIDDDDGVRQSLEALLRTNDFTVAAFASARDFLAMFDPDAVGCLITDVRLPGMSGMELLQNLRSQRCRLPVIVITGHGDVPLAVEAMKGGAVDFIEKPFRDHVLLSAVGRALQLADEDRDKCNAAREARTRLETLTPREHQVLDMVVAGNANKVIAIDLELSIKTVEFHRAHVMEKMGAESLAELVQMVLLARDASSPLSEDESTT